jgi:hypothetical protein
VTISFVNNHKASHLKLHLLSEGVSFTESFLTQYSSESHFMEKRRAYNNSDDSHLNLNVRIPQELFINNVVVAVNHKKKSPWLLEYDGNYYLSHQTQPITRISFPIRPKLFEYLTPDGVECGRIANLYGGASLAFFTPSTCYYFNEGIECHFCSLAPNRKTETSFVHTITPEMATAVFLIALESDPGLFKQIMLVGGNIPDYDLGFQKNLEIIKQLDKAQKLLSEANKLEVHVATMPPRDLKLIDELHDLNARITINLEVFDDQVFESLCLGKSKNYGRKNLKQSLEYAAKLLPGKKVHTILIAGLEPISSTINGLNFLPTIGVTPIINVFHNDRGSHLENYPRPSYAELLRVALELEKVYRQFNLTPYWNGCGRNSLDFEASHGWFSA